MTLETQTAATTGFPLAFTNRGKAAVARLLLRDNQGVVAQQWAVNESKCTLGSAEACGLRCTLPGVAPYHALIVVGSRQTFIRALAPKLTRNGAQVNEILLSETNSSFEIAGHKFELSRDVTTPETKSEPIQTERMKFTLARPFELQRRPKSANQSTFAVAQPTPQPAAEPTAKPASSRTERGPSSGNANTSTGSTSLARGRVANTHTMLEQRPASTPPIDPQWIAKLINTAVAPLQEQLRHVSAPLAELQLDSRRQKRLRKRKKELREKRRNEPRVEVPNPAQTFAEAATKEIEQITIRQSVAMDVLSERISDVNQQLSTIENMIAQERTASAEAPPALAPEAELQNRAIEQLQSGIIAVTTALADLQTKQVEERRDDAEWKGLIQVRLESLSSAIDGLSHQTDAIRQQISEPPAVAEDYAETLRAAADLQSLTVADAWDPTQLDEHSGAPEFVLSESWSDDARLTTLTSLDTTHEDPSTPIATAASALPNEPIDEVVVTSHAERQAEQSAEPLAWPTDGLEIETSAESVEDASQHLALEAEQLPLTGSDGNTNFESYEADALVVQQLTNDEAEPWAEGAFDVSQVDESQNPFAGLVDNSELDSTVEDATWPADPANASDWTDGDADSMESQQDFIEQQHNALPADTNTGNFFLDHFAQDSTESDADYSEVVYNDTDTDEFAYNEIAHDTEQQIGDTVVDADFQDFRTFDASPDTPSDEAVAGQTNDIEPRQETPEESYRENLGETFGDAYGGTYEEDVASELPSWWVSGDEATASPETQLPVSEESLATTDFEPHAQANVEQAETAAPIEPLQTESYGVNDEANLLAGFELPPAEWDSPIADAMPAEEFSDSALNDDQATDANALAEESRFAMDQAAPEAARQVSINERFVDPIDVSEPEPSADLVVESASDVENQNSFEDPLAALASLHDVVSLTSMETESVSPTSTEINDAADAADKKLKASDLIAQSQEFSVPAPIADEEEFPTASLLDAPHSDHQVLSELGFSNSSVDTAEKVPTATSSDDLARQPYEGEEQEFETLAGFETGTAVEDSGLAYESQQEASSDGRDPAEPFTAMDEQPLAVSLLPVTDDDLVEPASTEPAVDGDAPEGQLDYGLNAIDTERNSSSEATEFASTGDISPVPEQVAAGQEGEDDSVEDYMRRLLARMRGLPEDEVETPKVEQPAPAQASPKVSTAHESVVENGAQAAESDGSNETQQRPLTTSVNLDGLPETQPFDPEKYVPRSLGRESSSSNLAAMRELANSSARSAITSSTRQKLVTSTVMKASIAAIALIVSIVLIAINGLNVNIGLVATIASLLVAGIWGFDAVSSLKPLLQSGLVLQPPKAKADKQAVAIEPAEETPSA